MGSRCLPKTDEKYVTKPIHFFVLNSTAWPLLLVKQSTTMLSCSVLCYMRAPPMFPNLGHVHSLICLPHFENLSSLCFLLSGLIDGPLTSVHLAWMWPDSISYPLVESPQWPEVGVKFLCSVPISPVLATLNHDQVPGQSESVSSRDKIILFPKNNVIFSLIKGPIVWMKWS